MSWIKLKSESKLVGALSGAPSERPNPKVVSGRLEPPKLATTAEYHDWPPPELNLGVPLKVAVNESTIRTLRISRGVATVLAFMSLLSLITYSSPSLEASPHAFFAFLMAIGSFFAWFAAVSLAGEINKSRLQIRQWRVTTAKVIRYRPGGAEAMPQIEMEFFDQRGSRRTHTRSVYSSERHPVPVGTFMTVLYDPNESWTATSLYEILRYVHVESVEGYQPNI